MVGVCPLPHSQGRLSVAAYSVSKAQGSGLKCATSRVGFPISVWCLSGFCLVAL